MKIHSAEFIMGAASPKDFIADGRPQVAVAGRSNVGKSSLLNTLLERKNLARTGKTPGKTLQINYFLINDSFYLVDLPGFGYAKVSKTLREKIGKLITNYMRYSQDLVGCLYLIDLKTMGTALDLETVQNVLGQKVPLLIAATKRDKLNRKDQALCRAKIKERFHLEELPLTVSSLKKQGFRELWESIDEVVEKEAGDENQ